MKTDLKFCTDCRYHKEEEYSPICVHPNNLKHNLTTGEQFAEKSEPLLRSIDGDCSEAGNWWEPLTDKQIRDKKIVSILGWIAFGLFTGMILVISIFIGKIATTH